LPRDYAKSQPTPRGAARLLADARKTSEACGANGLLFVRAYSAFYNRDVIAAVRRAGARFSVTARQDTAVRKAIAAIDESGWTTIRYPKAVFDEQLQQWVSNAEVAETEFTAFAFRRKKRGDGAADRAPRPRPEPDHQVANAQGELFPAWRHHAVFTDSPLTMLQAEADHAIIEQVIADLKNGPLAHLPSGRYNANAAWLVLATMAFNLTRAAGTLAPTVHAKATTAAIRRQLINVPAQPVRSARRVRLRLATSWPWAGDWLDLFTAAIGPPLTATA
jgi:hypothetical protein